MTLGAFAALDQLPPTDPNSSEGRPRWSARFSKLLDAYEAEQQGLDTNSLLGEAGLPAVEGRANVGDAVVAALYASQKEKRQSTRARNARTLDDELYAELFGWTDFPPAEFVALPINVQPVWVLKILCCAEIFRRNKFGRLFPAAAAASIPSVADLTSLSALMNEAFDSPAGDSSMPAGFIFLGQFVDHDITLDVTTRLSDLLVNPTTVVNVRSPALDLDSVYGDGPNGSPELYDATRGFGFLLVGPDGRDLARNHRSAAIIGDPRNDENTIISQLHLHFLHFHNAVLRMIKTTPVNALWGRQTMTTEPLDDQGDFDFARRMVRWHYQWVVVNDYLPRIIEPTTLQAAHHIAGVPQGLGIPALPAGFNGAKTYLDQHTIINCCGQKVCRPLLPVEFSAAAFRFAHSQIRSRFDINAARLQVPLFVPRPPGLASFQPVPNTDVIEWERFFDVNPTVGPQRARQIDTWLAAQLFQLPFAPGDANLASRNLRRGARVFALQSGASVATLLGIGGISAMGPVALTKLVQVGIAPAEAPLWFYLLGEAELHGGLLGPVGGLLVAVTLLRILACDDSTYPHVANWSPVLVPSNPGVFSAADLLRIAVDEREDAFPM